jgi:hypothetical protein
MCRRRGKRERGGLEIAYVHCNKSVTMRKGVRRVRGQRDSETVRQ